MAEPPELGADRLFYRARSDCRAEPGIPVVSCIMPTAGRRRLLPLALRSFLCQTHVDAELVMVDDGDDAVADLVPADARIRYVRLRTRRPLGTKRNIAIEESRGTLIVHWDDDDWSHPDRLRVQVDALTDRGTDACGLDQMLWWDPARQAAWRYRCPGVHRSWVAGNTLAYLRSAWARSPFPSQSVGEDTAWVCCTWGWRDVQGW